MYLCYADLTLVKRVPDNCFIVKHIHCLKKTHFLLVLYDCCKLLKVCKQTSFEVGFQLALQIVDKLKSVMSVACFLKSSIFLSDMIKTCMPRQKKRLPFTRSIHDRSLFKV